MSFILMYRDKERKWQSASLVVIFPLIINMSMIYDICMYLLCAMDLLTARVRHHYSSPPNAPYMSANGVGIGSGNGMSPVRCQAITWTNADILLVRSFKTNLSEVRIKIQNISFITNAFKNIVCEMAVILPRARCVNSSRPSDAYMRR